MKAIISKFIPGWGVRGARYQATDGDGNTVHVPVASRYCTVDEHHRSAVKKLCLKMGWSCFLVNGALMKGGVQIGQVWVWRQEQLAVAEELVVSAAVKGCGK